MKPEPLKKLKFEVEKELKRIEDVISTCRANDFEVFEEMKERVIIGTIYKNLEQAIKGLLKDIEKEQKKTLNEIDKNEMDNYGYGLHKGKWVGLGIAKDLIKKRFGDFDEKD